MVTDTADIDTWTARNIRDWIRIESRGVLSSCSPRAGWNKKEGKKRRRAASDRLVECSFCTWLGEDIIIISADEEGDIVVTTDHVEVVIFRGAASRDGKIALVISSRGSRTRRSSATSAESSGACNAKRDRTNPPFARLPNNTLVFNHASSSPSPTVSSFSSSSISSAELSLPFSRLLS